MSIDSVTTRRGSGFELSAAAQLRPASHKMLLLDQLFRSRTYSAIKE
jgi:hypothetical protein